MAQVTYRNIRKDYGKITVLSDIDFSIENQEFVVLLGPSGCGKTTLLRMTAGLESITGGEVLFDDQVMNHIHARDRNISMVFQNYALYPQMTVFDNIAFGLEVAKMPKKQVKIKVEEALEILGLTAYKNAYPKALSGGQRQRVAMGRALVRHPRVFLFDEPLSNLDAKLRGQMRYEIRRIHNQLKSTTIYVTHDQIEAMTMADKIVVMNKGNIEQIGTPEQVYDYPATCFVALFVGSPSMNLMAGTVTKKDKAFVIDDGNGNTLKLPKSQNLHTGQEILFGIRPTDIQLNTHSFDKSDVVNTCTGTVSFVEKTGTETHIRLLFNGIEYSVVAAGKVDVQVDTPLTFYMATKCVHLFDKATQTRIATADTPTINTQE